MTERREEGDDGAALRPFGVAFVDPMFAMTERKEESYEGDLIKCLGSFLALLVDSQAAIIDEALLVEANNHPFSMLFFLGPLTVGLKLRVQDGSLEHSVKMVKGISVSEAKT